MIKISIVTVVYNAINDIDETILSILNQNYGCIEYIVIDGGSDDGTVEIINNYTARIKYWCSEKDNGIYDAMNKAISHATGDFLIFINAGDILCSREIISNVVDKLIHKNYVYYGNALYVNKIKNETRWRGGPFSKYRLSKTNICHQTLFYPRSIYRDLKYNTKYKLLADWVYNMQAYSKVKFVHINQDISYYDDMGVSALNNDEVYRKERLYIICKYLGFDCIVYLFFNKIAKFFSNKNYKTI